jgi:hypothetical protein
VLFEDENVLRGAFLLQKSAVTSRIVFFGLK